MAPLKKRPAIESATTAAISSNLFLATVGLAYSVTRSTENFPQFQLVLATGLLTIFLVAGLAARLKSVKKEPVVQISILLGAPAASITVLGIFASYGWVSDLSGRWVVVMYTLALVAISVFRCTFSAPVATKPKRDDAREADVKTFASAINL